MVAEIKAISLDKDILQVIKDVESKHDTISTGYSRLDYLLGGGLNAGRLYCIGAIPSLGKTTLMLNICDNIAELGRDVLIFSIEMSRSELILKLLVRKAAQDEQAMIFCNVPTFNEIINHTMSKYDEETLGKAIAKFSEGSSKHISVVEGYGKTNLESVEEHVKSYVDKGSHPVVVIDFLQIMSATGTGSEKQIVDRNLAGLKTIAINYNVPIWCISSLNRMSYLNEVGFESFKETGGVETWCDVVLGMHLYVEERKTAQWSKPTGMSIEEKKRILDYAKRVQPRIVEIVSLKNRMYDFGLKVYFDYLSRFETFKENEDIQEIEDERANLK